MGPVKSMKLAKKSLYRVTKYFWQGVWPVKGMKLAEKSSCGVIKPFMAGKESLKGMYLAEKRLSYIRVTNVFW